jgi:hypothetical protein
MEEELAGELEDLQLVEIQELLEEHGIELSEAEVADLAEFVKEAGGLEAAVDTLKQLSAIRDAA